MDKTELNDIDAARAVILDAALPEVPFEGWGTSTFKRAVADAGVDRAMADLAFPRGALDLVIAFHDSRDAMLAEWLANTDLSHLRYSERVGRAIEKRLDLMANDREAARRAVAFFALPPYAFEGGQAVWRTADTIWTGLGDTSRDYNWYTKRATLSAVYSASVLYWLGDQSADVVQTRGFVARRIDNVMQFEKLKSTVTKNPLAKAMADGLSRLTASVRAPSMPGGARRRD